MPAAPRVSIDLGSPTPAYRQIASDLRRHLVEQRLKPGDLLPPIRQLALDLGVHFNTVAIAYRMLADEGWLELKRLELTHDAGDRGLPPASGRIEVADLRERVRKLEAIAAGIDI